MFSKIDPARPDSVLLTWKINL